MRKTRAQLLPEKGHHNVLVANTLHPDIPEMALESREILRAILEEEFEKNGVKLLHWSITPRSYRAVVRANLATTVKHKSRVNGLFQALKLTQQRYGSWKIRNNQPHRWKDRVRTNLLDSPGLLAAAAISCDAMPMIQGITTSPDDYFFTSYWHAKQDDHPTIKSARKILKAQGDDWKSVKSEYRKLLKMTVSRR